MSGYSQVNPYDLPTGDGKIVIREVSVSHDHFQYRDGHNETTLTIRMFVAGTTDAEQRVWDALHALVGEPAAPTGRPSVHVSDKELRQFLFGDDPAGCVLLERLSPGQRKRFAAMAVEVRQAREAKA